MDGYNALGAGRQIRVKPRQGREAATVDVFLWVSCIIIVQYQHVQKIQLQRAPAHKYPLQYQCH